MSKFDPHDSSYDYSATSSSYGIATATAVPVNAYGYPSVPDVSPSAPVYSWNTAENNSMQQDSSKYRTGFSINEAGTRQYLSEMRWPEGKLLAIADPHLAIELMSLLSIVKVYKMLLSNH